MAGGNFDKELHINANGGIDSRGPLNLETDEVMEALYVWVFQPPEPHEPPIVKPGASCIDSLLDPEAFSDSRTTWRTKPSRTVEGTFVEGDATAMALAIVRVADGSPRDEQERRVFWWKDPVKLTRAPGAEGAR